MDGQPPQEEDFSSLSIEDRLAHKNWKARVNAYESLIKTFQLSSSESDPAFKPFLGNPDTLKKIVTDSNAVAQEKGVECVVALVKFAGENAAKTREAVIPSLVDKCFGSTRAGTKNQALELVLQYVEVENTGSGVVVRLIMLCLAVESYLNPNPTNPSPGKHSAWTGSQAAQDSFWNCTCVEGDNTVRIMLG